MVYVFKALSTVFKHKRTLKYVGDNKHGCDE
jgi:hypothetical protein